MPTSNKNDQIIGAPLVLDTASSDVIIEGDSVSPKQRGRSPPGSIPFNFPSPAGSIVGPGTDFGSLSPDAADLIYPIRSVVNISHPLQQAPGSPNTYWSANSSVAGSIASGLADEVGVGLGIQSRNHSRSPQSSVRQGRPASVASFRGSYDSAIPERAGPPSKPGSLSVSSIVEKLSTSTEEEVDDNEAVLGGREGEGGEGRCQPVEEVPGESYMTARFKHVMTNDGHLVVTGVSGAESIQRCEDEPIHIPGAVQGFGLLIAFKEGANGKLSVKIVSEVGSQLEYL